MARRSQFHQNQLTGSMSGPRSHEMLQQATALDIRHGSDPMTAGGRPWPPCTAGAAAGRADELRGGFYLLGCLFMLTIPLVLFMRRPRPAGKGVQVSVH